MITVFNKIDLSEMPEGIQRHADGTVKSVAVSAVTGQGLDALREALAEFSAKWREENQSLPREPEDWEIEWDSPDVITDEEVLHALESKV
jgi:GTP-binding protein HflX